MVFEMGEERDVRNNRHYIVFRIGADTDIKNGRIKLVEKTLRTLEAKEDYVACQALYDSLQYYHETMLVEQGV
jgi:hypothetical protein